MMKHRLMQIGIVLLGIAAVLVIEKKTGIFSKIFGKVPVLKDNI